MALAEGMTPRREARLAAWWYGGARAPLVARALSTVYGALMRLRRQLYRWGVLRVHPVPVPVIVVGNRTVGGAGKTPTVIALVVALRDRGWRPGVVSRGYGRRSRGAVSVGAASTPEEAGDEPLLIHQATGVPVEVDVDRVVAARRLAAAGCTVVVADDGLQHLRLGRRIEIEVQDGRGLGNGAVLPAGPLREPVPGRPADLRLVHGREPVEGEHAMRFVLGDAHALDGRAAPRPLDHFRGAAVHAVAGIGHPQRFFEALRGVGLAPLEHPFPDHHAFAAVDFAGMAGAPILMTSKDAVKCRALGLADAFEVPVDALLPPAALQRIDQLLAERHADLEP